jgi:N-acetylglucosamine kinase-like BadF-type ATPase
MNTPVIIGIDQGGTFTRAVVCSLDGRLLGYGCAPGACHAFQGMPRAMQVVQQAVQASLAQADSKIEEVRLVFGGFTGADWADEYPLLQKNVGAALGIQTVFIANDSIIAMRGGSEYPYGAILIAGSGGNCAVRAPAGREYIYGYYQEAALQGGGGLGRRTLDAVYQAEDGRRPPTRLTGRVLSFYGFHCVEELLRAEVENRLPGGIKELAPLVFEEALSGDRTAATILRDFGKGSAKLVTNGLRRFNMTGLALDVVLSGSVFKGVGSLLVDTLRTEIQRTAPLARLVNARYEPVVGAALLGMEKAGVIIDERINPRIEESANELGLIRACNYI